MYIVCTRAFCCRKNTTFGEQLVVVGPSRELGEWNPHQGLKMEWGDGHEWTAELPNVVRGSSIEFKIVLLSIKGEPSWEEGDNRSVTLPEEAAVLEISCDWNHTDYVNQEDFIRDAELVEMENAIAAKAAGKTKKGDSTAVSSSDSLHSSVLASTDATYSEESATNGGGAMMPSLSSGGSSGEEDEGGSFPSATNWRGREIVFMQSNEFRRERQGVWRTEGLEANALVVVEGDRDAGSWREKLEVLMDLLVKRTDTGRPGEDALAWSLIYLT